MLSSCFDNLDRLAENLIFLSRNFQSVKSWNASSYLLSTNWLVKPWWTTLQCFLEHAEPMNPPPPPPPQLVQVVIFTPWFELVKFWVSWSDGNHELFDEVLIAWIDMQRKTLFLKQSRQPSFLNQINVVMGKIAVFVQLSSEILLGSKKKQINFST